MICAGHGSGHDGNANGCGSAQIADGEHERMSGRCDDDTTSEPERIERLRNQLVNLKDPGERRRRMVEMAAQRRADRTEDWSGVLEREDLAERLSAAVRRELTLPAIELLESGSGEMVPVVAGEVLVHDEAGGRNSAGRRLGDRGFRDVGRIGRAVTRFRRDTDAGTGVKDMLRELRDAGLPGSPHYVAALRGPMKSLDGPEYTDHPPAWDTLGDESAGAGALVVVIDTGLDPRARTRTDGWLAGMEESDPDPLDVFHEASGLPGSDGFLDAGAGHGTFVAGLVRQFAPAAQVRVLRALDSRGLGTERDIADRIDDARALFDAHDGPKVLNLSLGIITTGEDPPVLIQQALERVWDDVIVVAAAGNTPLVDPIWPAWFPEVHGVAALTADPGTQAVAAAEWTNTGGHVAFSAIGDGVSSTYVDGVESATRDPRPECFPRERQLPHSYALWSGTSFSTPKIAGLLASVWPAGRTPADAVAALRGRFPVKQDGLGHIVDV